MVRRAVVVVLAATVMAACAGDDTADQPPSGEEPASASDFRSTVTEYVVDTIVVAGVEVEVRPVGTPSALAVGDGGLRLFTGCHDVIADYSLDREGDLSLSGQRGPRVGCPEADLQQADLLVQVVSNGARWTLADDILIARKDGIEVAFRPVET